MDEEKNTPTEEKTEPPKSQWQQTKEGWYSGIDMNLKQINTVVYICLALLVLVFILIGLEAAGIYSVFDTNIQ